MTGATTADLIAAVLAASDEDEDAWQPALKELQARPTRETFDAARELLASDAMPERELGVEILVNLGELSGGPSHPIRERPFREETVLLLLDLLIREREFRVLESIAYAFRDLADPRGIEPLAALADHPEDRVRFAVVHGLLRHEDERAIRSLIRLSTDDDNDVRDWATFGLAAQVALDTPAIRDALVARLDDGHENTREEAMYGLAMRLDSRAVPVLLEFLEEHEGPMLDSALLVLADHLDDRRLVQAIARRWPDGVPADARRQADSDYELASPECDAAG
jgi:HEAT repeat protein